MVSPLCQVKNGSAAYVTAVGGVNVTPAATIVIRLADTNVDTWSIQCVSTDDTNVAATIQASLTINSLLKTATFTAPAEGASLRFRSVVNGGIDGNNVTQSSYSTTFCIYTVVGSARVVAADETTESGSFGWVTSLNGVIRGLSRVTPLDSNHLHAWELDDASGDFVDTGSSASKVNLTATTGGNAPLYAESGIVGSCVSFGRSATATSSATARASALISAFSDLPTSACTMEIWCRCEDLGDSNCHLMGANSTASYEWDVLLAPSTNGLSSDLRTSLSTGSVGNLSGTKFFFGVWRYVAVTYDGTALKLYVDGMLVGYVLRSGTITWTNGTTPTMAIGKDLATNGQFVGQLSRFRLSNIARSQSYLRGVYQRANRY